jgi:hypothetical protein
LVVGATSRRSTSSLDAVPDARVLRQAAYFAGSVFITVELANFPVPIFANWKTNAVAISLVSLLICLIAFATGILGFRMLKARAIRVLTPVLAGLLSGIEIIQFAPFSFPLAFPWYIVIGGVLGAIAPMILTLLIVGYVLSKRKDPLSLNEAK